MQGLKQPGEPLLWVIVWVIVVVVMRQKDGAFLCMCVGISKQDRESKKKKKWLREKEREGDLTSALLEMGFLWMGELGEGWEHIKSHFQFVAGS